MKTSTIAPAEPIRDSQSIDAVYSGEDADWGTSGEGGGILVEESGGYVSVPGVDTLIFDDAGFALTDNGDGSVLIENLGGLGDGFELNTEGGQSVISPHGNMGATETFDPTDGNVQSGTLTADCTVTLNAPTGTGAATLELYLEQDGTGGWDVTWPGSVVWPGGVDPTVDTDASTLTRYVLETIDGGTTWYGVVVGGGGSGGTPATTVESETTWGITPAVGTDTEYARQDHTHGTPANPVSAAALETLGVRGELVTADGTSGPGGITPTSYVEMPTPDSTTSAALEDITGATTTITLQRTAHVAAWMVCHVSCGGVATLGLALNFDGTDHDVVDVHLTATDEGSVTVMHRTVTELPPGTYTVKGRMQRVSGGSTPSVDRVDLLVMSLGHSGPVLVTTEDETDYVYADLGA